MTSSICTSLALRLHYHILHWCVHNWVIWWHVVILLVQRWESCLLFFKLSTILQLLAMVVARQVGASTFSCLYAWFDLFLVSASKFCCLGYPEIKVGMIQVASWAYAVVTCEFEIIWGTLKANRSSVIWCTFRKGYCCLYDQRKNVRWPSGQFFNWRRNDLWLEERIYYIHWSL